MPAHTLTQGGITRQLIGLTLPLLLGNLIQQFYNTVDMMIVGQVAGQTPFAAIGVAGSLMSLFTCLLIGFNMGCSILFANRFGARDFAGLRRTVFTTGVILAGVTVLLTGVGLMCLDTVITLIQTPAELRADCRGYLFWILLGLAFTALYNLCATLLQALGKTQVTLLDSLGKRVKWLSELSAQLGAAPVECIHGRAEEQALLKGYRDCYDLAVSRAVADLRILAELCLPFVKVGGAFVPYKSGKIQEEIEAAGKAVEILGGWIGQRKEFMLPGSDMYRCLLYIEKVKATAKKYPRKAGMPTKEPLH